MEREQASEDVHDLFTLREERQLVKSCIRSHAVLHTHCIDCQPNVTECGLTLTLVRVTSTFIPHSLHPSASVTTRGLHSRTPYTADAKKKKMQPGKALLEARNKIIYSHQSCCSPHCSHTRFSPFVFFLFVRTLSTAGHSGKSCLSLFGAYILDNPRLKSAWYPNKSGSQFIFSRQTKFLVLIVKIK